MRRWRGILNKVEMEGVCVRKVDWNGYRDPILGERRRRYKKRFANAMRGGRGFQAMKRERKGDLGGIDDVSVMTWYSL